MHLKKVKGILSSSNGMNLYRGCTHGCIYCDSRSKCYHMEHAFEDVEVKENAIVLLENALKRKRLKCMLSTGSMTDPYIPLEDEFSSVRKALSLAYKYGFGFTLITKSNRVLKDLDLLKAINDKTKCVVQMTLTTYDEDLCKKIEPNVSTTKERVEALKKLHDAGIPTVVWLCPILPWRAMKRNGLTGKLIFFKTIQPIMMMKTSMNREINGWQTSSVKYRQQSRTIFASSLKKIQRLSDTQGYRNHGIYAGCDSLF